MRFELFIAIRYLRARRRQAVIGLVTAISIIGVATGVAALIIALAITTGMRQNLQGRLVGATAHVELMRTAGDGIRDWRQLMAKLRRVPSVEAVAPGLYGQVLISRGPRSDGALVKGIVPKEELRVGNLLQATKGPSDWNWDLDPLDARPCVGPDTGVVCTTDPVGTMSRQPAGNLQPIVLGSDLATTLGAQVGDTVLVTSPQGELTPLGITPRYQRFRVSGVFASGFYQYDAGYAFLRLADAQRLFSEPDLVSVLSFRIHDLYRAPEVGRALQAAAGPGFETTNWMEQNRELFRALKLEQVVTFIILALIVVVAALNILIALTMMVMEKSRDIAVLMSFGVSSAQVRRIFLLQGLLISAIGTTAGTLIGLLTSFAGRHYQFIHLDASVYALSTLPFEPRVADALLVTLVSLSVALVATLYPANSAASVLPAEALRYE